MSLTLMQLQYEERDGTHEAVVQRRRKLLQVKPDVEGTRGGDVDVEV